jgi:hypothetical protein
LAEHHDFTVEMSKLKQDLLLLQAGLASQLVGARPQRLLQEVLLRARVAEDLWAQHFGRVGVFLRGLEEESVRDKMRLRSRFAAELRRQQLEHDAEVARLQSELAHAAQMYQELLLGGAADGGAAPRAGTSAGAAGAASAGTAEALESSLLDDELEAFSAERSNLLQSMASLALSPGPAPSSHHAAPMSSSCLAAELSDSPFALAQALSELSRDDMFCVAGQLSDETVQVLIEALMHALSGAERAALLQRLIGGGALLRLCADDAEMTAEVVGDLSISARMLLLAQLLAACDMTGLEHASEAKVGLSQALEAVTRSTGTGDASRRLPLPFASVRFVDSTGAAGAAAAAATTPASVPALVVVGHAALRDGTTDMPQPPDLRESAEGFGEALVQWLEQSGCKARATCAPGAVLGFGAFRDAFSRTEAGLTLSVHFAPVETAAAAPAFARGRHPWEKLLERALEGKKVRDVSGESLATSIVGELYAKKVRLDCDLRELGRRRPLVGVCLDHFSEKYGLRKIAMVSVFLPLHCGRACAGVVWIALLTLAPRSARRSTT